jgi:hypothetical protein
MYGFQSIAVTSMGIPQYITALPVVPNESVEKVFSRGNATAANAEWRVV